MSAIRKVKDLIPPPFRRALAEALGVRAVHERLEGIDNQLNAIEALPGGLNEYLRYLEALVLANAKSPDGLPIPPLNLIHLVAGRADVAWFFEGGQLGAQSIAGVLQKNGVDINRLRALLDFGCGCGRVTRQWNSLKGPAIYGSDYNPQLVEWCRQNLPFAHFERNEVAPPLPFPEQRFDLVYALSVFTHLPENLQMPWMNELSRVLAPGGYLLITLHGRYYLNQLDQPNQEAFRAHQLVVVHPEAPGSNLCSVFHPYEYVIEKMTPGFELVEFIPEGSKGTPSQDLYLFKKRSS